MNMSFSWRVSGVYWFAAAGPTKCPTINFHWEPVDQTWPHNFLHHPSEVPSGYVPSGAYLTYAEAYGSATVPGACTDKWPTGSVWKDEENCPLVNGTAVGGPGKP